MTRATHLGELEQMVLLAVLRLGAEDAYASGVRHELAAETGRTVARGAVYITLDRLVKKGYLTSRLARPTRERGGRPNRFFEVTREGRAALRASRDALVKLWSGVEATLEER
jgi:PadR family transcriptional regulator PadR